MFRSIITLLCLGALAALAPAQAADAPAPEARSITVTGTGLASGAPDKARLRLSVQKSNPSMDQARADALAVVQRFLALARKLGIPEAQLRTTSAMVNPDYRWDQATSRQVLVGYAVQRELEVEVRDLDQLGALIEGAVDAGVNNVSPPLLDSSRRSELNRQALAAAARDAEANARVLADTLGMKLGKLRELSTEAVRLPRTPMPMARMAMAAAEADSGGAASYTPGSLEFQTTVSATFDILAP